LFSHQKILKHPKPVNKNAYDTGVALLAEEAKMNFTVSMWKQTWGDKNATV